MHPFPSSSSFPLSLHFLPPSPRSRRAFGNSGASKDDRVDDWRRGGDAERDLGRHSRQCGDGARARRPGDTQRRARRSERQNVVAVVDNGPSTAGHRCHYRRSVSQKRMSVISHCAGGPLFEAFVPLGHDYRDCYFYTPTGHTFPPFPSHLPPPTASTIGKYNCCFVHIGTRSYLSVVTSCLYSLYSIFSGFSAHHHDHELCGVRIAYTRSISCSSIFY